MFLLKRESNLSFSPNKIVCGVDEAGRGSLFGVVVAAAVILDPNQPIAGLADSKQLSPAKRQILYDAIHFNAKAVAVGRASVAEIDQLNILQASLIAMQRAVEQLDIMPDLALVDGNQPPLLACPMQTIVKGDAKHACISAASIIAKVTRDQDMLYWHQIYPHLGLDRHKGYPTKQHLQAIQIHGICPQHRLSFAPVTKLAGRCP